jgi:crossover junction endodeoxyribonuclease RuvC
MVLGIDPGAKGGLALVERDTKVLHDGMRMPTLKMRGKTILDVKRVREFIYGLPTITVIEQVGSMPGQGSVSAFSFGRITGAIEAITQEHSSKGMVWVSPRKWKGYYKLGKNKQDSIDAAKLRFGKDYHWQYKADDGIAEAALIALWYLEQG